LKHDENSIIVNPSSPFADATADTEIDHNKPSKSPMLTTLHVNGINCYSYHGCLEEELRIGGWFRVDVVIESDFRKAVESDSLPDAIDYVTVTEIVREQMREPSKLIEHAGGRILKKLHDSFPGKKSIELKITKLNPPVNSQIESAAVILREDFE
jgi:7,8-dihydroneopterin aldolase/epimerase/oxygenase